MEPTLTTALTYNDLAFPIFRNSRLIGSVGGTMLNVEDALRAALVTRSNVFPVGDPGTGKTQAASDILYNFFGGKGLFMEGRADFKVDELFTRVNLSRIKEARSSEEIIELTQNLNYHFFFCDELNRCPEITQNEFFSLANGYILFKGKRYDLGNQNYALCFATGNVGNGEFTGTFRMDNALLDRLHLILDLNYWRRTPKDELEISKQKRDPRVKRAPLRDISDKIVQAYESIGQPTAEMELIALYLTQGLDYCKKFPQAENSKRVLKSKFPVICHEKACDLRDKACGVVKPMEERAKQNVLRIAQGLQYIATMKNPATIVDPVNSMLIAYTLLAPHSRVLSPQYILAEENFGNAALAGRNSAAKIRDELDELRAVGSPVAKAYLLAKQGDASGIEALPAKYQYLKEALVEQVKS